MKISPLTRLENVRRDAFQTDSCAKVLNIGRNPGKVQSRMA